MPGGSADEELDLLLAEGTKDKLPTAPVPPPPSFAKSDADAELDSLLAAGDEPSPAPDFVDNPSPASGAPRPAPGPDPEESWFTKLLGINPKDMKHGRVDANDPDWQAATRDLEQKGTLGGVAKKFAAQTAATAAGGATGPVSGAVLGGLAGGTARAADDPDATAGDIAKSAGIGGAIGGAAPYVASGLSNLASKAKNFGNELLTHTFMTAPQRAGYKAVKGGDALAELGKKAEDAGLFKPRGVLDYLLPRNARRVAENAETVQATAGPKIGQFEDQYVAGSDKQVPVGDIAQNLRSRAASTRGLLDTEAPRDAATMEALADRIDQPASTEVSGEATQFPRLFTPKGPQPPPPLPSRPEPEQLTFVPDRTPGPPMNRPTPVQQNLPLYPEPEQTAMDFAAPTQTEMSFAAGAVPRKIPAAGKQMTFVQNQPYDSAAWKGPQQNMTPVQQPEQLALPPAQMSLPGVPARPAPRPEPWQPGQLQGQQTDLGVADVTKTPLQGEAQLTRESMPLAEAVTNKRDLGNRIDWAMKRSDQSTIGQEAARKYTWGELRDKITNALQEEVAAGKIPASAMADYEKNMSDFSTAATVYDPALKMAERNGQSGLSLTDMMAGAALGGGPSGGLAVLAHKATRGMAPATAARVMKLIGGLAEGSGALAGAAGKVPGAVASPVEQAQQQNPDAPKHVVVDAANANLKRQWYESLLPQKDATIGTNQ